MTFGFEAGVGFFVALVLCCVAVACIREIGILVLAAAGGLALWYIAACIPHPAAPALTGHEPPTWIGLSLTLAGLGYLALSLVAWGLNSAGAPYAAGRALRRLLKKPRRLPEQQCS